MIYSSPYPYFRSLTDFTLSDTNGAAVVQHDLLEHSLNSGICDSAEVFLEWVAPEHVQASLEAIRDLTSRYGKGVISLGSLNDLSARDRIVVAKNVDMAVAMMTTRSGHNSNNFPICLVTHALSCPNPLIAYTNLCLGSRVGDVIVATSRAAYVWIETMLILTAKRLSALGVIQDSLTLPRVVTIPIGTNPITPLDKLHSRIALGLLEDSLISLWLGRFSATSKADLEPLILLWPQIHKLYPTSRLILAGHDQEHHHLSELRRLVADLGIASSVEFRVNVSLPLKSLILSAADIFVSPVDNIQETFGVSVLEAMMHGLPVIASDWSGYRDIVVHGKTGLLIPTSTCWEGLSHVNAIAPHSNSEDLGRLFAEQTIVDTEALFRSMVALSGNQNQRLSFGRAGRERALQLYSWSVVIRQFGAVWNSQIEASSTHRKSSERNYSVDFVSLFQHYGSQVFSGDWNIEVTTAGTDLLLRSSDLSSDPVASLAFVKETPNFSLSDCSSSNSPSRSTVIWLLKKGFVAPRAMRE